MQLESSAIAGSMIPDALTPEQYYDAIRADDASARPIKRLMLAVLEDAMRCYQTYGNSRNRTQRLLFIEAEAWLMDRKADGAFAFETVCETVGIEPSCLRDGLRRWRLQQLDGMNPRRLARRSPVTRIGRISAPLRRSRHRVSHAGSGSIAIAENDDFSGNSVAGNSVEHHASDISTDHLDYDMGGETEIVNRADSADGVGASATSRTEVQELALA